MTTSSQLARAQVIFALKRHGDVYDDVLGANKALHERLAQMGVSRGVSSTAAVARELEDEGLVLREVSGGGGRTSLVVRLALLKVGDYEDPFSDDGFAVAAPPAKTTRPKSLDRILAEIEKLSLAEKMMVVGQIADSCAAEVEETYAQLRNVLKTI